MPYHSLTLREAFYSTFINGRKTEKETAFFRGKRRTFVSGEVLTRPTAWSSKFKVNLLRQAYGGQEVGRCDNYDNL